MLIFIHKRDFRIEVGSESGLYFKNYIIFELNVKVKILRILKWNNYLIEFEKKRKFAFWKWNVYFILKVKDELKLENIF